MSKELATSSQEGIAVIGMAGRFPGATDLKTFWHNICNGIESIKPIPPEEDVALKNQPALRKNPDYIPAGAFVEGIDLFDAAFFGYNAQEAQILDPQQRLFLEHAWEALEQAGYDATRYRGRIGVYAGCGMNEYAQEHVRARQQLAASLGDFQIMLANSKDFLATRVAYKLGLKGPVLTIQTACSTSLVAVVLACQSLLTYQCDMALAGGVSILRLEKEGYLYERGGIASPDGHCRTFSAQAQGTVFGDGVGIVVLKRLEDALAEGDQIYAVIKGAAMNNDGSDKVGFTAPSLNGQMEVIAEALALAQVEATSIGYVEAHGTGTYVGDPIEVAALTEAFRTQTNKEGFCALGSVKTNIGHTDAAAGIAGLIKTTFALKDVLLPPSLHFLEPNPQIDFAHSPFYVNTHLKAWPAGPTPRRAGVSAFGIGGTNAHVILEEPPPQDAPVGANTAQLIVLSAKTASALDASAANLATYIQAHPELLLDDIAYTLQVGRKAFSHRRIAICQSTEELCSQLISTTPTHFSSIQEVGDRSLVFQFPGQGAQYIHMGQQLYEQNVFYRQWIDICSEFLHPLLERDLRALLFSSENEAEEAEELLAQTRFTQPALFVTEYALAKLLETWGLKPSAMLGHSIGEYVAACLAGVFSLEHALFLVAERGRLMQSMVEGAMLSVSLPERQLRELLDPTISISAINAPSLCVVAGTRETIRAFATKLTTLGIDHRQLHTSHAFHSPTMEPALEPFLHACAQVQFHPPQIPFISCTTGGWITEAEATSPAYWVRHLRQPVRFADGLQTVLSKPGQILLEVGPGQTLTTFARQHFKQRPRVLQCMRHPREAQSDSVVLLTMLGKLWLAGLNIDFARLHVHQRRRVPLPTYPFERRRYWLSRIFSRQGEQTNEIFSLAQEEDGVAYPRPQMINAYAQPQTPTEQRVASLWKEVLGFTEIGLHDNFFELGGTSLLSIRLMRLLRTTFQVELPEDSFYKHQTIAAISSVIDASGQTLQRIQPVSRTQPLPASWQQRRYWVREHLHPGQQGNPPVAIGFEVHGTLALPLLEQSVNHLIARHEILRTSFHEVDGQLIQRIHPAWTMSISLIDLRHLPAEMQERELLTLANQQTRTPFALDRLPLWRLSFFTLGPELAACVLIAHQTIWDGNTTDLMLAEIGSIMDALSTTGSYAPPPLSIQYADIAVWEQDYFQGSRLQNPLDYWQRQLRFPLPILDLLTDHSRTSEYAVSKVQQRHLSSQLSNQLRALSHTEGTSLYILLLAIFKLLIYGYTRQEEIIVDTFVSMRTQEDTMALPGPFVNAIPLYTSLAGNPDFREVLSRVRATVLNALGHRTFPIARVLDELSPELYRSPIPTSRVGMALYESSDYPHLPGLTPGRRLWFRQAIQDIYVALIDQKDGEIQMNWEYNSLLFEEMTIRGMMQDYIAMVEKINADLTLPISEYAHFLMNITG